jgi:hypothetical protein
LSPDLRNYADEYAYTVDQKRRRLTLDGRTNLVGGNRLKVWSANRDKSKSGMISLVSVIRELGLEPERLDGKVFNVSVDGQCLEVQF